MKSYRSKEKFSAGKIKSIGSVLQRDDKVTCVLSFEDGTSSEVEYLTLAMAGAKVGQYWVQYQNGSKATVDGTLFESQYEEAN